MVNPPDSHNESTSSTIERNVLLTALAVWPNTDVRKVYRLRYTPQVLYPVVARVPVDVVNDQAIGYRPVVQHPDYPMSKYVFATIGQNPVAILSS